MYQNIQYVPCLIINVTGSSYAQEHADLGEVSFNLDSFGKTSEAKLRNALDTVANAKQECLGKWSNYSIFYWPFLTKWPFLGCMLEKNETVVSFFGVGDFRKGN